MLPQHIQTIPLQSSKQLPNSMSSPVTLTNGAREGEEVSPHRDVKNHMLFEVSTEAANRGLYWSLVTCCGLADGR